MGLPRICSVCFTSHRSPADCPGELRATGPERHGWRVQVATPQGTEAIGVLVAPSNDLWRARILTYPNVLWLAPGGAGTLKFAGATAREAESKAVAFVREHMRLRGFEPNDQMEPVTVLPFLAERAGNRAAPPRIPVAPRKIRNLPVRFGIERPSILGATINVSREGMYIGTDGPYDAGVPLRLRLDLDGLDLLLSGRVVWNRRRNEAGRPLGMGIRLASPSPAYQRWVEMIA